VLPEGLLQLKISFAQSGIEAVTFRLLTWVFNQLHHRNEKLEA
jgi:hypothetical protein